MLLVGVLVLFLAAFLAVLQVGFACSNKFKIELLSNQGNKAGKRLAYLLEHSSRLFTAFQLSQIIFLLIFACIFFELLIGIDSKSNSELVIPFPTNDFYFGAQPVIGTFIFLLVIELFPKLICMAGVDKLLYHLSFFLYHFYFFLSSIIKVIDKSLSFLFIDVFRFSNISNLQNILYLDSLAASSGNTTKAKENELNVRIFANALDFNKIKVREFMVPRTEIVALPIDASINQLLALFRETELSRIIIFEGTLDTVKGFVHSRSLFENPASIQDVLQPILMVPESMPANHLLRAFNTNRKSIAVVIDEFGGTAGLVTVEDLVEVVFGEIEDEYDVENEENEVEKQLDENSYLFSARLSVDYINQKYGLRLPQGEYTTLAGLVLFYTERIPQVNDTIAIDNYLITITEAIAYKINVIKIEKLNTLAEEVE